MFRTINSIKLHGDHFYTMDLNFRGNKGVKLTNSKNKTKTALNKETLIDTQKILNPIFNLICKSPVQDDLE